MPKGTNQKFKLYRLAADHARADRRRALYYNAGDHGGTKEYDITAERKSIYADLRDLETFGIDVEGEQVGNRYHYHVVNRPFEMPELKLLVDAIQSSKFITARKTNDLIRKLETFVSRYDAMKLRGRYMSPDGSRR